jgi:FkbM family methyltransferase
VKNQIRFGNKNISRSDYLRAYLDYLIRPFVARIRAFITYRKIYRNYVTVIFRMLRNDYPIEAVYRNGNYKLFQNRSEISFASRMVYHDCNEFEISDDKVTIFSYSLDEKYKRRIDLYDAVSNGEVIDIFFDRVYDFLPIHGKTVIDIGANIGDSCIYFAISKPNRIIAIEPFPRNYELAKKNIDLNGFADKIFLQLAGCHSEPGEITIDPLYKSNDRSQLIEFKQGIKIQLITLRDILIKNKVARGEAVLKMDCEGCEYNTILSSTANTLKFFSHIQLEYHQGYLNLKEKLENNGFLVWVTSPSREQWNSVQGKDILYTGFLYAIQMKQNMVDNLT